MKNVQILILKNEKLLISEVISIVQEIGEPDCKLVKPKLLGDGATAKERITDWLNFTDQDVIMIRSDDVLTFVEPTKDLLDYYLSIT
tara:strand:+ start:551 stop:811 length:261 start_codon:yes stop_codon:yes gene_type:complete